VVPYISCCWQTKRKIRARAGVNPLTLQHTFAICRAPQQELSKLCALHQRTGMLEGRIGGTVAHRMERTHRVPARHRPRGGTLARAHTHTPERLVGVSPAARAPTASRRHSGTRAHAHASRRSATHLPPSDVRESSEVCVEVIILNNKNTSPAFLILYDIIL
jgi:hypothetical protein